MITPKRVRSIANPSRKSLLEFFVFAAKRCEQGGSVFSVFIPLISIPPRRRLEANLRVMLNQMAIVQIRNVLDDGLTSEEKTALLELELHKASDELLGVAHGLLNVHERWYLLKSVGSKFRAAAENSMEFLQKSDLLGDILEDSS